MKQPDMAVEVEIADVFDQPAVARVVLSSVENHRELSSKIVSQLYETFAAKLSELPWEEDMQARFHLQRIADSIASGIFPQ